MLTNARQIVIGAGSAALSGNGAGLGGTLQDSGVLTDSGTLTLAGATGNGGSAQVSIATSGALVIAGGLGSTYYYRHGYSAGGPGGTLVDAGLLTNSGRPRSRTPPRPWRESSPCR